ncbi:MAG: toll/interleukin-1 receptor domain-containing protein [Anaerolineae bacterium]|nr:toll/interleukin-1 receptor domain-containing protein [Anaerolineae bacterium]
MDEVLHNDPDAEGGEIEAFCVRDRQRVIMIDPTPVWTGRGHPATRGECPICGGSVFRLGRTPGHERIARPPAIHVAEPKARRARLAPDSVYIAFNAADVDFAMQLAADLDRLRMPHWLHDVEQDSVRWAGGVHPALKECGRMVLVASPAALDAPDVTAAWQFFRQKGKPVIVAQVFDAPPPDALRRAPRFDFGADYRAAFRGLLAALNE